MTITIDSVLSHDAELRTCGIDGAEIVLHIGAGNAGFPFEARIPVDPGPLARIRAEERVAPLKVGTSVRIRCDYVEPRTDHGMAVICMRRVTSAIVGGKVLF